MKKNFTLFCPRCLILSFTAILWTIFFHSALGENSGRIDDVHLKWILQAPLPVDLTGTVTDARGEPLIGVNIVVKGTETGTSTDMEGKFLLPNVKEDAILVVSYIGYQTQEVPIQGRTDVAIVLIEDSQLLDEVVVVGYGEQSRETLTSSVTKLDNRVIENTVFGDAAAALQGTVSGVRVQTTSGQPGASPRVIVRGGTSINNPNGAQPLYVVDGVIRQDLDGINTADIESMQVLKDAAATAIYGARASNGVVIVSLKQGSAGKSVISYNYSLGLSQLREKYDVLNARDFIYFSRLSLAATGEKDPARLVNLDGAFPMGTGNDLTNMTGFTTQYLSPENQHKLNEGWQSMPDPLDPSKTIIFDDVDWQDVLFQTGVTHDHYLNFSGGSNKATFNLGVGYVKINGIALSTDYHRWSANLNGRVELRSNLHAYGSLNFSRFSDNEVFNVNQLFERALALPNTAKYTFEDGSLAPGFNRSLGNPAYHLNRSRNNNQDNLMTVSGGLTWEIIPDLVFEPVASLYYRVGESNAFQMSYYDSPVQFVDSRNASGAYSKLDQNQLDASLSYSKLIQRHNFAAKVGVSYFSRNIRNLSASGRGAASDLIPTLNASAEPVSIASSATEQIIFGYFGRITYDFDRRYLFTLNARYDGASNLGQNNKWGFFPGVSLGWNLHNESFWIPNDFVNRLKLRASYGVNGNLGNISDFQAQGQYSVGTTYDGHAAIEYTTLANQNLQWEQSSTFDFGFDASFGRDRFQLIFDYYTRVTDNLITSLALPYSTGFGSILTNLGSLENQGIELELSTTLVEKGDFSWDLSLNSSFNKNTVRKLPENDNENNRIGGFNIYDPKAGDYVWRGGLQEGFPIGELYAYQFVRVFATDEEAAAAPRDELIPAADKTKKGGDIDWLDVDGNGVIDTRDKVYMGNIYPKWTGGMSSTVSYKGLNLYLRMDYTTGHTIYNYTRAMMNGQFIGYNNASSDILRSWQKQGDQTDVPRYYWADQVVNANIWRGDPRNIASGNGNSQYYEKGDYLAVREITLSYNIPSFISSKVGFQNLRINITGNNLKYFTQYKGLAPEDGGFDNGRYPVPRVFTFGLKAMF